MHKPKQKFDCHWFIEYKIFFQIEIKKEIENCICNIKTISRVQHSFHFKFFKATLFEILYLLIKTVNQ